MKYMYVAIMSYLRSESGLLVGDQLVPGPAQLVGDPEEGLLGDALVLLGHLVPHAGLGGGDRPVLRRLPLPAHLQNTL